MSTLLYYAVETFTTYAASLNVAKDTFFECVEETFRGELLEQFDGFVKYLLCNKFMKYLRHEKHKEKAGELLRPCQAGTILSRNYLIAQQLFTSSPLASFISISHSQIKIKYFLKYFSHFFQFFRPQKRAFFNVFKRVPLHTIPGVSHSFLLCRFSEIKKTFLR